jgi:hypothetical protein
MRPGTLEKALQPKKKEAKTNADDVERERLRQEEVETAKRVAEERAAEKAAMEANFQKDFCPKRLEKRVEAKVAKRLVEMRPMWHEEEEAGWRSFRQELLSKTETTTLEIEGQQSKREKYRVEEERSLRMLDEKKRAEREEKEKQEALARERKAAEEKAKRDAERKAREAAERKAKRELEAKVMAQARSVGDLLVSGLPAEHPHAVLTGLYVLQRDKKGLPIMENSRPVYKCRDGVYLYYSVGRDLFKAKGAMAPKAGGKANAKDTKDTTQPTTFWCISGNEKRGDPELQIRGGHWTPDQVAKKSKNCWHSREMDGTLSVLGEHTKPLQLDQWKLVKKGVVAEVKKAGDMIIHCGGNKGGHTTVQGVYEVITSTPDAPVLPPGTTPAEAEAALAAAANAPRNYELRHQRAVYKCAGGLKHDHYLFYEPTECSWCISPTEAVSAKRVLQARSVATTPESIDPKSWRLHQGGGTTERLDLAADDDDDNDEGHQGVTVMAMKVWKQAVETQVTQADMYTVKGLKKGKKGHAQAGLLGKYKYEGGGILEGGRPFWKCFKKKGNYSNFIYFDPPSGCWRMGPTLGGDDFVLECRSSKDAQILAHKMPTQTCIWSALDRENAWGQVPELNFKAKAAKKKKGGKKKK